MVEGRTLLEHVVATAMAAELAPVVAVVPAWLRPPASLDDPRLRWIRNAFPERGLSLSLRLGIGELADEVSAALILLGDQPAVAAATISAVLRARGERPIAAALADGVLAPPVLVERTHFHLVDGLSGDTGLRDLLRENPGLVTRVPVLLHAPDVDTPADLGPIDRP